MSSRVLAVIVGIAALIVFGPLVRTPWLWDDKTLIRDSPVLADSARWATALKSDFWSLSANPREAGMFRPVTVSSYFVDRTLFGVSPVGPHAVNLLLHLLCALMVGLLAKSLGARVDLACLAAALFVFHPATVEAVANVSSRGDLLATSLVLVALLSRSRVVLVFISVLAAQLAKESAFVAVPLVLLVEWAAQRFNFRAMRFDAALAAVAATVIAFVLRRTLLGTMVRTTDSMTSWSPVLSGASNVFRYVKLVVLPSPLVPYAPETEASWLALVAVVVVFALAVAFFKRAPWLSFGVAWFLVATAPISQWLPVQVRFSGLLLYLPLVGVALAVSFVPLKNTVLWLVAVAWLVVSLTVVPTWRDDVALWSANAEAWPELAAPHLNLANALAAQKSPDAVDAYVHAIEAATKSGDNKSLSMAQLGVGSLLMQRAPAEAATHFEAARTASGSRLWQAGVNLAVAQFLNGQPQEAVAALEAQWAATPLRPVAEAGVKLAGELRDDALLTQWKSRLQSAR